MTTCAACHQAPVTAGHGAKYCDPCRKSDRHRHRGRRKGQMFVVVDCEGRQDADRMNLWTASFGREDGTSASIAGAEPKAVLHWLLDQLAAPYDGMKQVIAAFHFNWDTAVLARDFDPGQMMLVHKATARRHNLICGIEHPNRTKPKPRVIPPDEWEAAAHAQYLAALEATNGYMLSPKAPAGTHEFKLWSGPESRAMAWASEELLDFWYDNPRLTLTEYRRQMAEAEERQWEEWLDQLPDEDVCDKPYHRWDRDLIEAVITEGGEGDVIAWDQKSELALAATPRRRFYVEHRPEGDLFNGRRILDIHDIGAAFTGGLEAVIDTWQPELTTAEREIIAAGKAARQDGFPGWTDEQVGAYSEAECVAGARCARLLLDTIAAVSPVRMDPGKLFGSGSIAGEFFGYHNLARRVETHEDPKVDWFAWLTYFGGLIESICLGRIVGQAVEEDDLNSAYPAAAIRLPCMAKGHGHWKRSRGAKGIPADGVGHVLVTWAVETATTPPFVVRMTTGRVVQPLSGVKVWVSLPEYTAACEQFPGDVSAHEAVWWVQDCECPCPFAWMEEFYYERVKIKAQMKTASPEQWQALNVRQEAIKLILNSCYGKLAQRRPTLGKYTNLHYASYITGYTRAQLRIRTWQLEAAGNTVVYLHTDGIKYIGPARLPESSQLGDAKHEDPSHDVLFVQPGLLAAKVGKDRSRGIRKDEWPPLAWAWAETTDFTQHPMTWEAMDVVTRRMMSRRLAIHEGKPEKAGIFYDKPSQVGIRTRKRDTEAARRLPGEPEAWMTPPIQAIAPRDVATLEDIKQHETRLARLTRAGEFDQEKSYA